MQMETSGCGSWSTGVSHWDQQYCLHGYFTAGGLWGIRVLPLH